MQGIVLATHGKLAEGMIDAGGMFFGEQEQLAYVELGIDTDVDVFDTELKRAVESVNTGDGVVVLVDLQNGTPANRAAYLASPEIQVIVGINMTVYVELLCARTEGKVNIGGLVDLGKASLQSLNALLGQSAV